VPYGDSGRAGILSHGSVLSAFSKFTDTSPTQRGIFVRTRLLCQTIGRPPANVTADKPPGDQDAVCKTDRYAEHRSNGACAGCHDQLDPIGFGLEQFDIAGRRREHDQGLPQCAIDGQGAVTGYGDFSGPGELATLLVENDLVQDCVVRQLTHFALGRKPQGSEEQLVGVLAARFGDNEYAFDRLLIEVVANPAFALRREPEVAPCRSCDCHAGRCSRASAGRPWGCRCSTACSTSTARRWRKTTRRCRVATRSCSLGRRSAATTTPRMRSA
jgi:hypothetical protein